MKFYCKYFIKITVVFFFNSNVHFILVLLFTFYAFTSLVNGGASFHEAVNIFAERLFEVKFNL